MPCFDPKIFERQKREGVEEGTRMYNGSMARLVAEMSDGSLGVTATKASAHVCLKAFYHEV
jgi:hypothetical protein